MGENRGHSAFSKKNGKRSGDRYCVMFDDGFWVMIGFILMLVCWVTLQSSLAMS